MKTKNTLPGQQSQDGYGINSFDARCIRLLLDRDRSETFPLCEQRIWEAVLGCDDGAGHPLTHSWSREAAARLLPILQLGQGLMGTYGSLA